MEERPASIQPELDRIFREWSERAALLGAALFLALSPLDFYGAPALAWRFLAYRVAAAAALVASAAAIHRARTRTALHSIVFAAIVACAATLELMVLQFRGHHSPHLIGLILLALVVSGLIPSGARFSALVNGTIFAVYVVPILLWDTIDDREYFTINCVLFFFVLAAGVVVRWAHRRHLEREIALRHELTRSRERLETESAQHLRTGAALRESRDFLASITASAMNAIVMIDPQGAVRFWNPAAEAIFGYRAAEAVGRGPFTFLVAPEKAEGLLAEYRRWQETGASPLLGQRFVSLGRRKDGELFPLELAITAVPREGCLWACALLSDVTERERNEQRLSLLAAAVDGAAEGIYIVDLAGTVLSCNPAAARQSGRDASEVIGRSIHQMHTTPALLDGVILPAIQRSGSWAGEISGISRDGQPLALWLSASLVRDGAGRPTAMVGLTRDLTDQKRLEAEHVRTQKLESIGVLAGGLAHDFNNLLTIILGNLDLVRLFAAPSPDVTEALDHAAEAALRAGDLTRQLITFSKGGQPVKRAGNLVRTVRETVTFAAAGSSVACEFDLPEDLPRVDFDPGQIRQVVHNLVQNAREAMPGGGKLLVTARAVAVAKGAVPGLSAGRYLRLEFADWGTGISREHLSRIFDPYFSTKGMDTVKGRGLGLAVSFSIVRNHGGTIVADSLPGEGTRISVYFPEAELAPAELEAENESEEEGTAPASGAEAAAPSAEERLPDGPVRGRVLVMDDEPLVLEMAGAALRRLGYATTLCRSGAEAIVQYQIGLDAGRRFAAVILDLTVPGGIGGPETLARLREIDPEVRGALSSGYTDHPAVTEPEAAGFAAFIAKPYSLQALAETLERLG